MSSHQEAQSILAEARKQAQIVLDRANVVADKLANSDKDIALISQSVSFLRSEVAEIKGLLKIDYVTRSEFLPLKVIVYTVTSVAGGMALVALFRLILK